MCMLMHYALGQMVGPFRACRIRVGHGGQGLRCSAARLALPVGGGEHQRPYSSRQEARRLPYLWSHVRHSAPLAVLRAGRQLQRRPPAAPAPAAAPGHGQGGKAEVSNLHVVQCKETNVSGRPPGSSGLPYKRPILTYKNAKSPRCGRSLFQRCPPWPRSPAHPRPTRPRCAALPRGSAAVRCWA